MGVALFLASNSNKPINPSNIKTKKVVYALDKVGFFFNDQKAIRESVKSSRAFYSSDPVTSDFASVRQAGKSISVPFILEDNSIAHGDCVAVRYSGAGGRDPLFLAENFIPIIMKEIAPLYEDKEITTFRQMADLADKHISTDGKKYRTAIRHGITQTYLDAVAESQHKLMAQIVVDEYGMRISDTMILIFSQSSDNRYLNVDKMIMKEAGVLPHALFNNVKTKVGLKGEKIKEYLRWLRDRIVTRRQNPNYQPAIHIDVYGTLSIVFNNGFQRIADCLHELSEIVAPFELRVEGPVSMDARKPQIEALAKIRELPSAKGSKCRTTADEWCNTPEDIVTFSGHKTGHMVQIGTSDLGGINNTIEAVLCYKQHDMRAYLDGTCNETNRSAEVYANIAMATSPCQCPAKPGMGVDGGYVIIFNEMSRVPALKDMLKWILEIRS